MPQRALYLSTLLPPPLSTRSLSLYLSILQLLSRSIHPAGRRRPPISGLHTNMNYFFIPHTKGLLKPELWPAAQSILVILFVFYNLCSKAHKQFETAMKTKKKENLKGKQIL